jgi:hypothetical protein
MLDVEEWFESPRYLFGGRAGRIKVTTPAEAGAQLERS